MSEPTKCAHPACSCIAPAGSKFCSDICADSAQFTALKCDCKHPKCEASGI